MNGYKNALESIGYKVIDFREFGDYQGEFCAFVEDISGALGFINDVYGSCGGCDQYQSDMEEYSKQRIPDNEALVLFGNRYKDALISYEVMIEHAKNFSDDATQKITMLSWVKKHEEEVKKYQWKKTFDKEIKG